MLRCHISSVGIIAFNKYLDLKECCFVYSSFLVLILLHTNLSIEIVTNSYEEIMQLETKYV